MTISPTQISSRSHTGTLPAGEDTRRSQWAEGPHMPKTEPSSDSIQEGTDGSQRAAHSPRGCFLPPREAGWYLPTPMTHAVRAAGASGNDYPQPQRTGQFHGTQGALDHGPSRVERPHPSLQCHGPPSHSTGAGDRRTREGRLSGKHSSWKHVPCSQEAFPL